MSGSSQNPEFVNTDTGAVEDGPTCPAGFNYVDGINDLCD